MTPFERTIELFANFSFSIDFFIKSLLLVGMIFYVVFGVMVVRQVSLMAKTLNGNFDLPIKIIAWVHLGMIIGLFLIILLAG